MGKPIVAIVGKQNVGKSTFLNRVAGKPLAIVDDLPGTTRDRTFADISWQGVDFVMIDTGGLEPDLTSSIARGVHQQIKAALEEADVVIFMVDVHSGITSVDKDVADMLRRISKPVILVANKVDNAKLESEAVEFYELGFGEPFAISAYHGRSTADLLDKLVSLLPPPTPPGSEPPAIKVAIVGRPNVGKSMLLNCIIGKERSIVDATSGTTRDAIDTMFDFEGQKLLLIDTAGIRRSGRVAAGVEKYSVIRALRAIERADIVLLVIDSQEPVAAQDTHIAGYVQQMAKGVILVVNKWDLVTDKNKAEWDKKLKNGFKFLAYAPVLYTSAKLAQGVERILPMVRLVYHERLKRLSTAMLNQVIQQSIASHNLPRSGKKQLRLFYVTQAEVNPPTFIFFVNDAKLVHFSYKRYLENRLRLSFGFEGTPIRLLFKSKGEE